MSGFVGDLSHSQEEALKKLRSAVLDISDELPETDDHFFLRWLRARKFKVDKAEQCIRNHVEFRRHYGVGSKLNEWTPPEVLTKFIPGGFFGEDREGHPVWHSNMGNLDIRGLCHSVKKEDILKYVVQYVETCLLLLEKCSDKCGKRIETFTSVIDLEHLSYRKHFYWPGVVIFREILSILEANYPERIERVFIVRAPKIFPVGFNLLKHFMDERTKEKIVVFGSNADSWKEELQKHISPDQLPQAYGGTRCEPDPYCTDHIEQGGDIPQEYLMTEASKEDMERVIVGRREKIELEFYIDRPGTVLRWEFVTVDHGMSFGWYFKSAQTETSSSDIVSVVPTHKVNSHLVPEDGFHECTQVGTYILRFDNSHSWTHSKEVFYSVKLLPPGAEHSGSPSTRPHPHSTLSPSSRLTSAPQSTNGHGNEDSEQEGSRSSVYFTPSPGPSLSPAESREEIDSL